MLVGGHIDSWDVGTGAMDDAGGCIVAWEAVRLLKTLGLRPRRTVRVVLFTNEENGLRGGLAYRDRHQRARSTCSRWSRTPASSPAGFGFSGIDAARAVREARSPACSPPIGATAIAADGGGADIGPLVRARRRPGPVPRRGGLALLQSTTTRRRTPWSGSTPREVADCAAAVAVMAYVVADLPERLPWAPPATPAPLTGP